jgi:hypothetical protein
MAASHDFEFLADSTEETTTRFITLISPNMHRFDLAITTTHHFYGKKLVTDLQSGRTAILGPDDLELPGYLADVYRIDEEEKEEELRNFLYLVVGVVTGPVD